MKLDPENLPPWPQRTLKIVEHQWRRHLINTRIRRRCDRIRNYGRSRRVRKRGIRDRGIKGRVIRDRGIRGRGIRGREVGVTVMSRLTSSHSTVNLGSSAPRIPTILCKVTRLVTSPTLVAIRTFSSLVRPLPDGALDGLTSIPYTARVPLDEGPLYPFGKLNHIKILGLFTRHV